MSIRAALVALFVPPLFWVRRFLVGQRTYLFGCDNDGRIFIKTKTMDRKGRGASFLSHVAVAKDAPIHFGEGQTRVSGVQV